MTEQQKKLLEEIAAMEKEMHELEKDMTIAERRSLIHGMDDEPFEVRKEK